MGSEPLNLDRERRSSIWTAELVDVLRSQRAAVIGVAVAVCASGLAVAAVAPTVLAPRPLVGAAVALAACLLGVGAAVGLDAARRVVRAPRDVQRAGGVHVATVGAAGVDSVVAWLERRLDSGGPVRLAVAAVGVDAPRGVRLTEDVALGLASRGWRALWVDLRVADGRDGIAEVVGGSRRLSEVVDYHPTLDLAQVGSGHDRDAALAGLAELVARLPSDVDALLVTLARVRQPGVLPVLGAMSDVLLVAQAGTTIRSELTEAIDALHDGGTPVQVVLVEDDTGAERTTDGPTTLPERAGQELPGEEQRPGGTATRVRERVIDDAWDRPLPELSRIRRGDASGDAWERPPLPDGSPSAPSTPDDRDATAEQREAVRGEAIERLADEIWARERASGQ